LKVAQVYSGRLLLVPEPDNPLRHRQRRRPEAARVRVMGPQPAQLWP
jgi:hypothetical protein